MSDLLIPYALSGLNAEIVLPDRAFPGGDYDCPECLGKVGIKIPTKRRTHFFHLPPYEKCALNPELGGRGEGQIHAQAKHMLYSWLYRWLSGEVAVGPTVAGKCATHQVPFSVVIPRPSPFSLYKEFSLPSGRRLDVALLNSDHRVTMGFEVKSKHAVTAAKAEGLPARWLELRAESIIKAFEALIAEREVPAIEVIRWAEYDQPPCCKLRVRPSLSSGFGTMVNIHPSPTSVHIPEPIQRESGDSELLSAAGKACCSGQTPKTFAASYAAMTGKSETAILRRLQEYGVARSAWSWV